MLFSNAHHQTAAAAASSATLVRFGGSRRTFAEFRSISSSSSSSSSSLYMAAPQQEQRSRRKNPQDDRPVMNEAIRAKELRVLATVGGGKDEALGIMSRDDALAKAKEMGDLDLIMINDKSDPPVCKIVDYSKYRYMQEKKAKEVKKNSKATEIKEVKMSYKIDVHDYDVRKKSAMKFLQQGNRVKCTVMFRGREAQYDKLGYDLLDKLAGDLDQICVKERRPKKEGKNLALILQPRPEVMKQINEERRAGERAKKKKRAEALQGKAAAAAAAAAAKAGLTGTGTDAETDVETEDYEDEDDEDEYYEDEDEDYEDEDVEEDDEEEEVEVDFIGFDGSDNLDSIVGSEVAAETEEKKEKGDNKEKEEKENLVLKMEKQKAGGMEDAGASSGVSKDRLAAEAALNDILGDIF